MSAVWGVAAALLPPPGDEGVPQAQVAVPGCGCWCDDAEDDRVEDADTVGVEERRPLRLRRLTVGVDRRLLPGVTPGWGGLCSNHSAGVALGAGLWSRSFEMR